VSLRHATIVVVAVEGTADAPPAHRADLRPPLTLATTSGPRMGSMTSVVARVGSDGKPFLTLEHDRVLYVIDDAPVGAAVARVASRLGVQDQVLIVGLEAFALPG
jgi:hypothetical protein